MTATIERPASTTTSERYAAAAKRAGCPQDQWQRFVRAGIVLQPKQLEAAAAARLCDVPGGPTRILMGGARGPGKTFWGLSQVAADDSQRFPGLKTLFLRKVKKAARESFEDLRQNVLINLSHHYNRNEGILYFPNGSRIVLGHFQKESDIDQYLGIEYDVILTEEATTLSESKDRDISTCLRSSKPGWRPRRYYTANPGGVGHQHFKAEFVEPYRQGRETSTRFIPSTARDNRFVNPDYLATLESLTGWKRRAWLDGDWDIAAGQFFTTFRRDVHVIEPFPLPAAWNVWGSLDYGFTHYTVCHLYCEHDGRTYVVDEHAERQWPVQRHAPAILRMLERNGVQLHRLDGFFAGSDIFSRDRDGRTVADDYREHGIPLTAGISDRVNGAGHILTLLGDQEHGVAPTLFISSRCHRLIDSLPALQHDPHRPEDVLKWDTDSESGEGGDDAYDSLKVGIATRIARRTGASLATPAPLAPAGNPFLPQNGRHQQPAPISRGNPYV